MVHTKWSRENEVHGKPAKLIAHWIDLAAYYCDSDGVVWSIGVCGGWVNRGQLHDFLEKFRAGGYRGKLVEEA